MPLSICELPSYQSFDTSYERNKNGGSVMQFIVHRLTKLSICLFLQPLTPTRSLIFNYYNQWRLQGNIFPRATASPETNSPPNHNHSILIRQSRISYPHAANSKDGRTQFKSSAMSVPLHPSKCQIATPAKLRK